MYEQVHQTTSIVLHVTLHAIYQGVHREASIVHSLYGTSAPRDLDCAQVQPMDDKAANRFKIASPEEVAFAAPPRL